MIKQKYLFISGLLLMALSLFSFPVFAEQVFTYVGHIGYEDPKSDNLVAHVMFVGSTVFIESGGITRKYILWWDTTYTSTGKFDSKFVIFSTDRFLMIIVVGSTKYEFKRL